MKNTPSPVVFADSKFRGSERFLCVDVRFRNREQIDTLIGALIKLRDSDGKDADHIHLQDDQKGRNGRGAEVTFHRPGLACDQDQDLLDDAVQWLRS